MSVFNSLNVSVLVVLLVAGLVMGLGVAGIDLLNPTSSAAEAARTNIDSAHIDAMNKIEERRQAAKTDAEIQQTQREQKMLEAQYEHDKRALELDLKHRALAFQAWMTILTYFAAAISIAIVIVSFAWAFFRKPAAAIALPAANVRMAATNQNEQEKDDVKKYWQERRQWARDNEEWFRSVTLMEARLKAATNSQASSDKQRSNLPLAI
ncbi:MAG: hypothetical protein HFACDABA_01677 [Anaerolineales bacterium]|nr:hypothetical protein [Anaerolineales bacterium]